MTLFVPSSFISYEHSHSSKLKQVLSLTLVGIDVGAVVGALVGVALGAAVGVGVGCGVG